MLYDDNHISIDGNTALSYSDDVLKRFSAYGWAARRIDGHDPQQINAALSFAMRSKKPTLIACRTIIGLGAPTKAGTAADARLAARGRRKRRRRRPRWAGTSRRSPCPTTCWSNGAPPAAAAPATRRAWLKRLAHSTMHGEFERVMAGKLPDNWHEAVAALKQEIADTRPKIATRQSSQKALEALVPATPELIGGSADLTGSNLTFVKGMGTVDARQLRRPLHPLSACASMACARPPTAWRCMAG